MASSITCHVTPQTHISRIHEVEVNPTEAIKVVRMQGLETGKAFTSFCFKRKSFTFSKEKCSVF